jgi:hypothetical protein
VATLLRTQSRAGILAAAAGGLVAIAGARALAPGRLAASAALLVAISLGTTWVIAKWELDRFGSAKEDLARRAQYWKLGLDVLEGRRLTGSGLGTYDASSFARLTSETTSVLFLRPERAHNDYVNLASDLGVPAALAGIGAVLLAVGTIARRLSALPGDQRGLAAGALGGAIAGLVHAFFDFGLELAPVGAAFALVLGVGWGATTPLVPKEDTGKRTDSGGRSWPAWSAALLLVIVSGLAFTDLAAERLAAGAGSDPGKISQARRLAPDDALLAAACAHAQRAANEDPIAAARAGAHFAPASATTQAELALALLDASSVHPELRAEGERRLALALELGPSWGALHYEAACYWIDRTAETNDRAQAASAVRELREARRLQLPEQESLFDAGRRRIEAHLRKGRLGALGEEMLRDLLAETEKGR